jgi:uncharacterized membrane protein
VQRVADEALRIQGAILVSHHAAGNVTVQQTGDHRERTGAGRGGAVAFLVGVAAPPLPASVAVGAAAGAVVGKFADHKLESGLHDERGEAMPPGTAAVIVLMHDDQRAAAERALTGSSMKCVVETDKNGTAALRNSLDKTMGTFSPDRTVLPIPDREFGGVTGRTPTNSIADRAMIPGPSAPKGAPSASSLPTPTTSAGTPCGSTATGCSTIRTRSVASTPTRRY